MSSRTFLLLHEDGHQPILYTAGCPAVKEVAAGDALSFVGRSLLFFAVCTLMLQRGGVGTGCPPMEPYAHFFPGTRLPNVPSPSRGREGMGFPRGYAQS